MLASRDPGQQKITDWIAENGDRASAGTLAETAEYAEIAVLSTGWSGTEEALQLAGSQRLSGKVVIDVTNPLIFGGGGPPTLALAGDDSGGEQVQRWLPGARVVKAFNIVGNAHMGSDFPGGRRRCSSPVTMTAKAT